MVKLPNTKPKTGDIVVGALKKLMKNTGWTSRTITKFIRLEYRIADPGISRKISRALKRGLRMGLLKTENGRYRLSDVVFLSRGASLRNIHRQRQKKNNYSRSVHRKAPELQDYRLMQM